MVNESFKEFKSYMDNNDFDGYLLWQGYNLTTASEMELDIERIRFDISCKDYKKEFKTPNELLEYTLKLYFSFAAKYNVNFCEILNKIKQ